MKPPSPVPALLALLLLSVCAAGAARAEEAPSGPAGTTSIRDTVSGYEMSVPYLVAPGENPRQTVSCVVLGPTVSGFSPNVNLSLQKSSTRQQFMDATASECKTRGWGVPTSTAVVHGGKEAVVTEMEGTSPNGVPVRCKSLAVFASDKVYLMTCTALKANFHKHLKSFDAAMQSFKVLGK